MQMSLRFLQGQHRGAILLSLQERREQHEHCKALRPLAVPAQGDLRTGCRPELDLCPGEHVEHPTWHGLDGNSLTRGQRNHRLHVVKSGLDVREALVRRDHEFVDLPELVLDFLPTFRGQLRIRQKWSPERPPGVEVSAGVTQRGQIEIANLILQPQECVRRNTSQLLSVEVQERPVLGEVPCQVIVYAFHA